MKKLTTRHWASVKRIAKNVNPLVMKLERLKEQKEALESEMTAVTEEIQGYEQGIITLTGKTSSELMVKVMEPTGKLDSRGKEVKVARYLPSDIVIYSEEENCYYIKDDEANVQEEAGEEETAGLTEMEEDIFEEDVPVSEEEIEIC